LKASWNSLEVLTVLAGKPEPVAVSQQMRILRRTRLSPLDKRSGAVFLVILSAVEMAFLVEALTGRQAFVT